MNDSKQQRERVTRILKNCNTIEVDTLPYELKSSIKTLSIPSNVVAIGHDAFCECYNLCNVKIPGSVKIVGRHAFDNCYSLE